MTSISIGDGLLTMIQVFTVEPRNQQELLELLANAYEGSMSAVPGFVSCSLHRGLEGDKVTLYVQWRSQADYDAMLDDASLPAFLYRALTISTFEPGRYEVMRTFGPRTGTIRPG